MAFSASDAAQAIVTALEAENPRGESESVHDYMVRIETARVTALWGVVMAQARITVNADVALGIAVQVNIGTGTGATTAPGSATTTTGTIA
jgi:hypothetical protein